MSPRDEGWQRKFDDPIEMPDGTRLNTLREAVAYLAKTVSKSERDLPAVTTARGDADIRCGAGDRLDVFGAHGRDEGHHWGKRKLKRDQ